MITELLPVFVEQPINRNMRCIEMRYRLQTRNAQAQINRNMRCIEIAKRLPHDQGCHD